MPKKSLGQHFLTDPAILERIAAFSGVGPADTVVEVGPGRGALTRVLAARVEGIIAIEVDRHLVPGLRETLPSNATLIEADALEVDYLKVAPRGYHVVANLPYNIATPLIERFVSARASIRSVTVLIQKEVADRILASPGGRDYGALTVAVQHLAEVDRGFVLEPGAFSPPPKVRSRVIRLRWRRGVEDNPRFVRFVRGVFSSRRKTLVNNLVAMRPELARQAVIDALEAVGHRSDVRAERISVSELERLYSMLDAGTLSVSERAYNDGP